jgi:hypothetical protein
MPALGFQATHLGEPKRIAWMAGACGLASMNMLVRHVSVYALFYGAAALGLVLGCWYE